MDTGSLRKARAKTFWNEVLPYFRYVMSSGLAAFLFILFLISTYYYVQFLNQLPEHFPVHWVAVACLLPTIAMSPIRTYLESADLMYLLPAESSMKPYILRSIYSSFVVQSVVVVVVWIALWPLFRESTNANGITFLLILLILMVLKWVQCYGHWHEMHCVQVWQRRGMIFFRWLICAILLWFLFTTPVGWAGMVTALVCLLYVLSLRIPESYTLHWMFLIERERMHRTRFLRCLSWFVEVPEYQERVSIRSFIHRLPNWFPFKQDHAYHFLYFITWIRSDVFGIVIRLMLIGMLMMVVFSHDLLKMLLFYFFIYLTGIQLSTLSQYHQYHFWIHLVPIPEEQRIRSVHRVICGIHLLVTHIMFSSFFIKDSPKMEWIWIYLLGIVLFSIYHLILRKKLLQKQKNR